VAFNDFEDPVCDAFWKDIWVASSVHNTEIYRKVFHAIPDDLISTWKQYTEFVAYHDRFTKPMPDEDESEEERSMADDHTSFNGVGENYTQDPRGRQRDPPSSAATAESFKTKNTATGGGGKTKGAEGFDRWEREQMERLLGELNGHLVIYPTRFLEGEDIANNFLFNADRLLPLPIYV